MVAVWFALKERLTPEAQFYILCNYPGSLRAVSWGAVLLIVAAVAVSVTGTVRVARKPSRSPLRPSVYLAVALALLVGADSLDAIGGRIAYRQAVDDRAVVSSESCETPYYVTLGWFTLLTSETRPQFGP